MTNELIGDLYWRTKDGVLIELKRVSVKDFMEVNPTIQGIPVVYAVWPTPAEEKPNVAD